MKCALVFWLAICYKHCLTLLRLELLREEHLQIAFSVQLSSLGKRERKDQRRAYHGTSHLSTHNHSPGFGSPTLGR